MKLHDLAHGRTGDKGDVSNISVIAYRPEHLGYLQKALTIERVAEHLGHRVETVTRYDLPQLGAMNFVIRGALKGGVTRSLELDAHGKCLSSVLLDMPLPKVDV
ncbi:AtuA-related protein [Phaeobacter gallaeciensis]|uniref:AtuA-related protein n=1 Tax=Phaeobacter gallaeciensis TaxID=60890 RepID=UPI00237F1E51|nr:hypothetical protein [Phaeobacter gallaeciensis]MDE4063441.1 hypothetical protein [Phaeobacter gallaeciensis]MDE4126441.1 hypothetical protein [Phaeobacter gallaeciensis]MDE4130939.1 hypothetical protein [Phaeobacter gallaeciensis]